MAKRDLPAFRDLYVVADPDAVPESLLMPCPDCACVLPICEKCEARIAAVVHRRWGFKATQIDFDLVQIKEHPSRDGIQVPPGEEVAT